MGISSIGALSNLTHGVSSVRQGGSPFSQVLASATGNTQPPAAPTAAGGTPQQQYNQALGDLQKTLAELFSAAGIDTSQPIAIEQGPEGNLSVTNAHPDMEKIEQILATHPELSTKFKAVAANLRVVKQASGQQNLPDPTSSNLLLTFVGGQATANIV
jgi:hypothetical protein